MDLTSLYQLSQKTLAEQGFKLCSYLRNDMTTSHFIWHDDDVTRKKVSGEFGYEAFYGNWLELRQVSHRNGAKYNTSYYLVICECERSSARDIKKVKLKCAQVEKTLVKKINQIILEYKQYCDNKVLAEKINDFLNNRHNR